MRNKILLFAFGLWQTINTNAQQGWSELGGVNTLNANSIIFCATSDGQNNIYAAGSFTNASFNYYVAKYDGINWSELGGANMLAATQAINSICSDAFGNIYAAGDFTNISGNNYIAKYDGTTWSELGGLNSFAPNSYIVTVCADVFGNIYAGGNFTNSLGNYYIAKYDGISWSELGGANSLAANGNAFCFDDANGNIYAAGGFTNSAGNKYVAKWTGSNWIELGGLNALAANGYIGIVSFDSFGNVYAAGNFTNSFGSRYVAKYDGIAWSELGGVNSLAANAVIQTLFSDSAGNVYAGGYFTNDPIFPNGWQYLAKYDGSHWTELGGANSMANGGAIYGGCSDGNNNVYVTGKFVNSAGNFYVARYGTLSAINLAQATKFNITLHPNPADNLLFVDTNQLLQKPEITYSISDVFGNIIKHGIFNNDDKISISLNDFPLGVYFFRAEGGIQKFVKY